LATWVPGRGRGTRHASIGAAVRGTTTGTGATTTASELTGTKTGAGCVAPSRSEAAQQLSASDWLNAEVLSPPPSASGPCMGQAAPSTQQAIRASGVAAQPAQRPEPPPARRRTSAVAAMRLANSSTGSTMTAAGPECQQGSPWGLWPVLPLLMCCAFAFRYRRIGTGLPTRGYHRHTSTVRVPCRARAAEARPRALVELRCPRRDAARGDQAGLRRGQPDCRSRVVAPGRGRV
jgi:hypothetical protein